jgi:polyhydroxybutyrate depolymerase
VNGGQPQSVPLSHGGRSRPYLLQVPQDADGPLPLVLELHGRGMDPVRFDRYTGFSEPAESAGFALALPSAVGGIWNDGRDEHRDDPDDVGYLIALIDDVAARVEIDPARVSLVGMSNGAAMAGRMAIEHGERLAGVAQVAGTAGAALVGRSAPHTPLPLLHIHGTRDQLVPYEGGVRRGLVGRVTIRRTSGSSCGVEPWLAMWVGADGAGTTPDEDTPAADITKRTWHGAIPGNDVVAFRVEGGGHTWPGSRPAPPRWLLGATSYGIDATAEIWEFLAARRRISV